MSNPRQIFDSAIQQQLNKSVMDVKASQDSSTNIFLTGAILLANMDYSGLTDYAIKAAIGGAVWMAFKLTSDLISERIKRRGR